LNRRRSIKALWEKLEVSGELDFAFQPEADLDQLKASPDCPLEPFLIRPIERRSAPSPAWSKQQLRGTKRKPENLKIRQLANQNFLRRGGLS
jgi:hypothetical protein